MGANYDRLFQLPEGGEIPDAAGAEPDFDVGLSVDISSAAPVQPESPRPPMPVAPAESGVGPSGPNGHAPAPVPFDLTDHPPAARPKPPPVELAPPPQHSRHARQDSPAPAQAPRGSTATSRHSHRANSKPGRGNGVTARTPPLPRTDAPLRLPPTGNAAAQPGSAASRIGAKPAKKPAAKVISQRGWRRWVHRLTRINVGLSRDEKYELDLHRRVRRNARGSYEIAILGLKGGAGKTCVTVALGSALAQVRCDRVLAFDADPNCGNLADRAGHQSGATIADLLADKDLTDYNAIRAHTSKNAVHLEVLAAEDYSSARRAFSEADWHYAADAVSRFYNLVVADCGSGLFDPVTRGVLSTASAVVIVTSASTDGARQAAVAIDWLRSNGHQDLLTRTCVVINNVSPGETNIAVAGLVRHFGQYVQPGRVIVLPWDKHIAAGTEIQLGQLDPLYKRRILELAAALSDDFDRGERR